MKRITLCSSYKFDFSKEKQDNEQKRDLEARFLITRFPSVFDAGERNTYYWNQNILKNNRLNFWKSDSGIYKENFKTLSLPNFQTKIIWNEYPNMNTFEHGMSRITNLKFLFKFQIT